VFRQTVAAVPEGHFAPEDTVLLAAFARSAALERRASEELQIAAVSGRSPSPWVAVHTAAVNSLVRLSGRLRLGPRGRDPANRRRARTGAQPSYYDQMAITGAHTPSDDWQPGVSVDNRWTRR
jgi:hypothetical protein